MAKKILFVAFSFVVLLSNSSAQALGTCHAKNFMNAWSHSDIYVGDDTEFTIAVVQSLESEALKICQDSLDQCNVSYAGCAARALYKVQSFKKTEKYQKYQSELDALKKSRILETIGLPVAQ
jgi:hypothetical protein